jgi:hypothetical protein
MWAPNHHQPVKGELAMLRKKSLIEFEIDEDKLPSILAKLSGKVDNLVAYDMNGKLIAHIGDPGVFPPYTPADQPE